MHPAESKLSDSRGGLDVAGKLLRMAPGCAIGMGHSGAGSLTCTKALRAAGGCAIGLRSEEARAARLGRWPAFAPADSQTGGNDETRSARGGMPWLRGRC